MDLFASIFGVGMIVLSVWVTYHLGIKPAREAKKREAERALAEMRQQRDRRSRRRTA